MKRSDTLKKRYRDLCGEADAIRAPYRNTDTSMTDEECVKFDRIMTEAEKLWEEVSREEQAEKMESRITEPVTKIHHPGNGVDQKEADEELHTAFRSFLKGGIGIYDYNRVAAQLKTLQADLDVSGGYLVAPQLFVTQLLKNVDDLVFVRRLATVIPLPMNESLGVPSLDTDLNDADWTTELATGSLDTVTRFGKRELRPHPFAKRVKVSNKLLRSSLLNPEDHVRTRMAYKFGVTGEKGYLTGNGSGRPLGVFTASDMGIPTSQDVTIGTTTEVTADGLIDLKHTLKPQYWNAAQWVFHRDVVKAVRKLKDGTGQYLWEPGLQAGLPNTILDRPYNVSEFAPNTFTTGQYLAVFGDFGFYWIADAMGLQIQRLDELYAEENATGFIGRAESDGMPVLAEAFVRGKLA